MSDWYLAKSLQTLRTQVNAAYPDRLKDWDGTIGDDRHAQTASSHNPNKAGAVTAMDITHDPAHGFDSYAFADYLIAHPDRRCRYVISNGRIAGNQAFTNSNYGGGAPWKWRPYTRPNKHDHHVHINAEQVPALYDDPALWDIGMGAAPPGPPPATVVKPMPVLKRGSLGGEVRVIQWVTLVETDGYYGPATETAVKTYQGANKLEPTGIVGPETWAVLQQQAWPGPPLSTVPPEPLTPPIVPPVVPPVRPEPAEKWQQNIIASMFGGRNDRNTSAYDGHVITDSELSVALPWHFTGGARPKVEVKGPKGTRTAEISDVGPWMVDDDYWSVPGQRPIAETCHFNHRTLPRGPNQGKFCNGAGIDLSPALADAVGVSGMGMVDFRFV